MNVQTAFAVRSDYPRAGVARRESQRALAMLRNPNTADATLDAAWTVARDALNWLGTLPKA